MQNFNWKNISVCGKVLQFTCCIWLWLIFRRSRPAQYLASEPNWSYKDIQLQNYFKNLKTSLSFAMYSKFKVTRRELTSWRQFQLHELLDLQDTPSSWSSIALRPRNTFVIALLDTLMSLRLWDFHIEGLGRPEREFPLKCIKRRLLVEWLMKSFTLIN